MTNPATWAQRNGPTHYESWKAENDVEDDDDSEYPNAGWDRNLADRFETVIVGELER